MAAIDFPRAPHWAHVRDFFDGLPQDELLRRMATAWRMVRENGITYNLYDAAAGMARPWELDVVPFVLGAGEWGQIEAAVAQRARLADAILQDVYGPQQLVAEGLIPAHLVYGHPQYLSALRGSRPRGGVFVHLFSVDLARGTDGEWTVLSSRVDAPSGIGYALENRIVISRTFPELFGGLAVQRIASFFADYREAVFGLAQGTKGRAVFLTPGPYHEAYFEHAFLAHYLGLELVEGADLVARDRAVFLRTIGGLARVGAIFRRLDSEYCDPVELRADSALGIPGLVDAVRAGGVLTANALGGGVAEAPALEAYLANVARRLGEELIFPGVPTIWCGSAWGRQAALARMAEAVVRDAFDARPLFSRGSSARFGPDLTASELAALADLIRRRGATVVVQDVVPLGHAPTFEAGGFASRPMSLRVFAAWTPNGYTVMPGGLARVAADEGAGALSMQSGGASKDVWVLSHGQVDMFSLLRPASERVPVRRSSADVPSRAMDNLFWLGRYVERTENLVRILRAIVGFADEGGAVALPSADLARRLLAPYLAASLQRDAPLSAQIHAVAFGTQPQSLAALLARVSRAAWSVRDRLSVDSWRAVVALTAPAAADEVRDRFAGAVARAYLERLIRQTATLAGLSAENMTRGMNWLFFDLGRRIERVTTSCDLVRHTFFTAEPSESDHIQIALEIADSAMTYRYRYLNAFQPAPALDVLVLDTTNPRATAFALATIMHHTIALPERTGVQRRGAPKEISAGVLAAALAADVDALVAVNQAGYRPALGAFLTTVNSAMVQLSRAVGLAYFRHATRDAALAAANEAS